MIEYFSSDEFSAKLETMEESSGVRSIDLLKQEEIDEIKKYADEIESRKIFHYPPYTRNHS